MSFCRPPTQSSEFLIFGSLDEGALHDVASMAHTQALGKSEAGAGDESGRKRSQFIGGAVYAQDGSQGVPSSPQLIRSFGFEFSILLFEQWSDSRSSSCP